MDNNSGTKEIKSSSDQDGPTGNPSPVKGVSDSQKAQKVSDQKVDQDIQGLEKSIDKGAKGGELLLAFFTGALVFVGLLQFGAALLQWRAMSDQLQEMRSGSTDTHNLAVAVGNQATWTQNLATNMQTQADRTKIWPTE